MPISEKPSGCDSCVLRHEGKGFVPDKVARRPRLLFVGEAPGKNEIVASEPFVGQAGFVLKNWGIRQVPVLQLALERSEITLANTLRCLPPEVQGRPYPKGETKTQAEACCRQYDQDVSKYQVVVLFGESPQRARFGPELAAEDATDRSLGHDVKGVMGRVGRVIERDGVRYIFGPHPAFVLRQPALVEHLQQALKIAVDPCFKEPAYVKWDDGIKDLFAVPDIKTTSTV